MKLLLVVLLIASYISCNDAFNLVLMGARRGKGDLKKRLTGDDNGGRSGSGMEQGAQEITGVTLPDVGKVKGWEFGNKVRLVCANVDGSYYALQGDCPRCGFDLWKGDLISNDPGWTEDMPRVACPTCSTTFGLRSGLHGPPIKRKGLAGFVGNLAKSATINDSTENAKAFDITTDDDGRVFCKEKKGKKSPKRR